MPNALTRTDATRTRDGEDFLGAVREKERDGERGREDRERLGAVARAREGRALARHQHVQRIPRRQLRTRVVRVSSPGLGLHLGRRHMHVASGDNLKAVCIVCRVRRWILSRQSNGCTSRTMTVA